MKKFSRLVCVLALIIALSVPAFASQSFGFWIENYGPSAYDSNSATKTNTSSAYVDCNQNTVYWPVSGLVLRVRNASHNYATVAGTFSNGQSQYLSYLSGQNYTGTKWLYGSISDSYASGYFFKATGTWTP